MERDPFSNFNPETSPEKSDKDSKSEKKSEKKRSSFMEELLERRAAKEQTTTDDNKGETESKTLREIFSGKEKDEDHEVEPTKKELAKEFLEQKAADLREEIDDASPDQTAEAQADLELVEAIAEKIDEPDKEVEPAVQEAYDELMKAIDESELDNEEMSDETLKATENADFSPEGTPDDLTEDTTASIPPSIPTSPTTTAAHGSGPTPPAGGGAGTPPGAPPTPPTPPGRPVPPFPPVGAVPPPPGPNFNAAPASTPESLEDQQRRIAGKVIVAGAIGYMIGRRGGRKRTEAKLKPEIKKRDETIVDLRKNVEAKEVKIREAARSHERDLSAALMQAKIEQTPEAEQHATRVATELHPTVQHEAPEHIGQKTAETPHADQQRATHEQQLHLEKDRDMLQHIETVPTPQLLHIAEKIKVLDTTVKKLYETNQIDRHGLEEIVKEHLKGHDISPVLDKRLLGHEAILERSHEYRHDPTAGIVSSSDDDKKQAEAKTEHPTPPLPPLMNQSAAPEHPPLHTEHYEHQKPTPTEQPIAQQPKQTTTIAALLVIAIMIAFFVGWLLFSLT